MPKAVKNGAYVINLDEYANFGTHWIALYVKNNEVFYFDSLSIEYVPKEIKRFIEHKNIKVNIFRVQEENSIMCGCFCIGLSGVYSRDNLPKAIKNGAYVINLDEYANFGTHWIALYVKNNEVFYFDSLSIEYVPKEIKRFIEHKNIKVNIFRVQEENSIMCGYFCIGFCDFMLAGKELTDFTSFRSPYDLNYMMI